MGAGGVYLTLRFFVLMERIKNLSVQVSRLYLWDLLVIYLFTVWVSSTGVSDWLIEGHLSFHIASLHVTSRRPCWWSRTKAFLSSGN